MHAAKNKASVGMTDTFASENDGSFEQEVKQDSHVDQVAPEKPKRPQSAYFLFMLEKRVQLQAEHGDWGVADVGKECGRLWGEMADEEKKKYHDMTLPLKEQYEKDLFVYEEKMKVFEANRFDEDGQLRPARITSCLPLARIKKIMKLDPELKSASKEAAMLVSWCTELFLSQLSSDALAVSSKARRRGVKYEDISAAIRKNEQMLFLAQDFPIHRAAMSAAPSKKTETKGTEAETPNGAGTLNSFFAAAEQNDSSALLSSAANVAPAVE